MHYILQNMSMIRIVITSDQIQCESRCDRRNGMAGFTIALSWYLHKGMGSRSTSLSSVTIEEDRNAALKVGISETSHSLVPRPVIYQDIAYQKDVNNHQEFWTGRNTRKQL